MQCVMIKYLVISLNVFQQLLTTLFALYTQTYQSHTIFSVWKRKKVRRDQTIIGKIKYTAARKRHVKPFIFEQMGEKVTCVQGYILRGWR